MNHSARNIKSDMALICAKKGIYFPMCTISALVPHQMKKQKTYKKTIKANCVLEGFYFYQNNILQDIYFFKKPKNS